MPTIPKRSLGRRQVIFSAADLGLPAVPFAFPAGAAAGNVFTTGSIKAYLDAMGFHISRFAFVAQFTPAAADSFESDGRGSINGLTTNKTPIAAAIAMVGASVCKLTAVQRDNGQVNGQIRLDTSQNASTAVNSTMVPCDDLTFILTKTTALGTGTVDNVQLMVEE